MKDIRRFAVFRFFVVGIFGAFAMLPIGQAHGDDWNRIASSVAVEPLDIILEKNGSSIPKVIRDLRQKRPNKSILRVSRKYLGISQAQLGKLILSGIYDYPQFPAAKLTQENFWGSNPFDNPSWEFHHHQWSAIDYLVSAYLEEDDPRYFDKAVSLLRTWAKKNGLGTDYPSDFSWSDHTSALRVNRLLYLLEILKLDVRVTDELYLFLLGLLNQHVAVLTEERFYNRNTNHGFDQAFSLFSAVAAFPEIDQNYQLRSLAEKRLLQEIGFMFTPEGVHVENSPGYHWYLLNSLKELRDTLAYYGVESALSYVGNVIELASEYMVYVTKPDGLLPLVGDTVEVNLGKSGSVEGQSGLYLRYSTSHGEEGEKPRFINRFYPQSGYAILRNKWPSNGSIADSIYVLFKSSFLSSFHRQDDDLNIVVSAFGEDWLVDSGRYTYQEGNPIRKYMRSNKAHNVPVLVGIDPNRDLRSVRKGIGITGYGEGETRAYVSGKTTVYEDFDVSRKVRLSRPHAITITDVVEPLTNGKIPRRRTYFQVPADKEVVIDAKECTVTLGSNSGYGMRIKAIVGGCERLERIKGSRKPPQGLQSREFGELKEIQSIIFHHKAGVGVIKFGVVFDDFAG